MPDERDAFTVNEFAKRISVGRTTAYKLLADGEVKVVRVGRKLLIPAAEITRFLARAS